MLFVLEGYVGLGLFETCGGNYFYSTTHTHLSICRRASISESAGYHNQEAFCVYVTDVVVFHAKHLRGNKTWF